MIGALEYDVKEMWDLWLDCLSIWYSLVQALVRLAVWNIPRSLKWLSYLLFTSRHYLGVIKFHKQWRNSWLWPDTCLQPPCTWIHRVCPSPCFSSLTGLSKDRWVSSYFRPATQHGCHTGAHKARSELACRHKGRFQLSLAIQEDQCVFAESPFYCKILKSLLAGWEMEIELWLWLGKEKYEGV